jgi:branched-subunit amino acid ABC-type transport system permease component
VTTRVAQFVVPIIDGLAYGLLLYVVAAGLTLVFGAGGVLNLAHGALYAVGAYAGAALCDGTWTGLASATVVGTAASAAVGLLLGLGLVPLADRGHLVQALYTFGVALVVGAVLVIIFGPDELRPPVPDAVDRAIHIGPYSYPAYRLGFIAIAAALAVVGWLLLARSRAGARIRAAVDDPQMLATIGTPPLLVTTAVMAAGGGLAGLAGVLGSPILGAGPRTGELVLLLSLVVVILGRPGSMRGAFLAAVAVGQVQSIGVIAFPVVAPFLLFGTMAVVLLLRRQPMLAVGGRP